MISIDSATLRNIQILALDAVEHPDFEAHYRKICRWYSKQFSTPLATVEEMSVEKVLQTYYEDYFQQLKDTPDKETQDAYETLKQRICTTDKEHEEESQEEDDWMHQLEQELNPQPENPNIVEEITRTVEDTLDPSLFSEDSDE